MLPGGSVGAGSTHVREVFGPAMNGGNVAVGPEPYPG
jgi:hypothetical protein